MDSRDTDPNTTETPVPGAQAAHGPWNPGLRSQVPDELLHLATTFRAEHVRTTLAEALELRDLSGLDLIELVAFRPRRLALHELLVRVTADISVPDGPRIEDLGIQFRRITSVLYEQYLAPHFDEIDSGHEDLRRDLEARIAPHARALFDARESPTGAAAQGGPPGSAREATRPSGHAPRREVARTGRGWRAVLGFLAGGSRSPSRGSASRVTEPALEVEQRIAALHHEAGDTADPQHRAGLRALERVASALLVRHGALWGNPQLVTRLAVDVACATCASDAIGRQIAPWIVAGAKQEGYAFLPRQERPVVMNTKGASASGKSTLRPLQKALADRIGVAWNEFALISPDIWRKQLLDYGTLGASYKYGGAFTGEELRIVDEKLDRYMAHKAGSGNMPHLLIDRFRFDSFAADSNEAGSNLLTRFGKVVYLFFMITPPESLVPRAWFRGLEVGRYKAVDDTLAHAVEAYSGMPEVFFTWLERGDKEIHFEFLDNSVAQGHTPRTAAFGSHDMLNVLDPGRMLDVERFRKHDIAALRPEDLYPDRQVLASERNATFLKQCAARVRTLNLATQDEGRIYLQLVGGEPAWFDGALLSRMMEDPDHRAAIAALAPSLDPGSAGTANAPKFLADGDGSLARHTVGAWGAKRPRN